MRVRNGKMLNGIDGDEHLACEINGLWKLRNGAACNLRVPSHEWILRAHDIRRERPRLGRPFRTPVGPELESTLFGDQPGQLTPRFIVSSDERGISCGKLVDNFLNTTGILHGRSSRPGRAGGLVA